MAIFLILLFLTFAVALCMAPGCALRFLGVVIGIVVLVGASAFAIVAGISQGLEADVVWWAGGIAWLGYFGLHGLLKQ